MLVVPTMAEGKNPVKKGDLSADAGVSTKKVEKLGLVKDASAEVINMNEPANYIVMLDDVPLASYRGGVAGLKGTHPSVTGKRKVDAKSAESKAYINYLADRRATVLRQAETKLGRELTPFFEYYATISGFAVEMTPAEAEKMAEIEGVFFVEREKIQYPQTDAGPEWLGATGIWDGSATGIAGTKGEGIIVGVIDTGIDPWNPSFADIGDDGYNHTNPNGAGVYGGVCDPTNTDYDATFTCNDKLIGAWDFTDYGTPRDNDGHGSHTASTSAGNFVDAATITTPTGTYTASIKGVAPHANVIMYRGCNGGCPNTATQAGRDQALLDGVDVINYSIGGGTSLEPWTASEELSWLALRDAGIFVATSAGNSGPDPHTLGSPADVPWITSVGANTHNRKFLQTLTLSDGTELTGKAMTSGYGPAEIVFSSDYTDGGIDPEDARLCKDGIFPAGTFSGEIVICERGAYGRVAKGQTVLDGGAGGYILAQRDEVGGGPGALAADPHVLPAIHIDYYTYQTLKAKIEDGIVQGTIDGTELDVDDVHGDVMTGFSSRGPNSSLPLADILVPKVTAPGRDIWAAYHHGDDDGDYTFNAISGTSMSSPHVAGAGALMVAVFPDWTPAEIESALMLTARNTVLNDDELELASAFAQGSGHVDLRLAPKVGFVLDVTTAEYMDANPEEGGDPKELNLASLGNAHCVGTCVWTRTLKSVADSSVAWTVVADVSTMTVDIAPSSFTLAAGGTQEIVFTANANSLPYDKWAEGTIDFTSDDDDIADAHMPIAIQPSPGNLPIEINIETRRDAGSVVVDGFETVAAPNLTFTSYGFNAPTFDEFELNEDPTNDIPEGFYDDLSQVYWKTIVVPAGAGRLVLEVVESMSPDVDMAVGFDTNGNGEPDQDEQVCQSTTGSWDEYCNVNLPDAGTWWVVVLNWSESADAPDAIKLATTIVGANTGNLIVEGPASVALNEQFEITVLWDFDEIEEYNTVYGAIALGTESTTAGNIGLVPVTLFRDEDDVVKDASTDAAVPGETINYTILINPNITPEDMTYAITDTLPAGLDYVEGSAETSDGSAVEVVDGVLTWSGVIDAPEREYVMSTSWDDPNCAMPFANSGAYVDLMAFGFGTNPDVSGNDVTFVVDSFGAESFSFFGQATDDNILNFTDDGFVFFNPAIAGDTPETHTGIPNPADPNNMLALFWRDMEIVYDADNNYGVTTDIGLGTAAKLLEFDDIQVNGSPDDKLDFEVVIYAEVDDAFGAYEIRFAYDNIQGDVLSNGTIGLENADGTMGAQFAYDDIFLGDLSNGMAVCFDWNIPPQEPVQITYQAVANSSVGTTITNSVNHSVDNYGSEVETASSELYITSVGFHKYASSSMDCDDNVDMAPPGIVNYCYDVINAGGVDIASVEIVDDILGEIDTSSLVALPVGDMVTFMVTDTYTTSGEVIFNTAVLTATDVNDVSVVRTDDAIVTIMSPDIDFYKTVTMDPEDCGEESFLAVPPGTEVTYCYIAENHGYLLTSHVLSDTVLGNLIDDDFDIDYKETFIHQETVVITEPVSNDATWISSDPYGNMIELSSSAEVVVVDAAIVVEPEGLYSIQFADSIATQSLFISNDNEGENDNLHWQILATSGWIKGFPMHGELAPGENIVVDVVIDSTDVVPGMYDSVLTIESNDPLNPVVEVPVGLDVVEPQIEFYKTVGHDPDVCSENFFIEAIVGDEVTYCYVVENMTPITLTHHTIVDDELGNIFNEELDLGPWEVFTHTETVFMETGGVISSVATATSRVSFTSTVVLPAPVGTIIFPEGDYVATAESCAGVFVNPKLMLNPMEVSVTQRDVFTVNVSVEGLVPDTVNSFEFALDFLPSKLRVESVLLGDLLGENAMTPGTPHIMPGHVYYGALLSGGATTPSGGGLLAQVVFKALQPVTASIGIHMVDSTLGNAEFEPIWHAHAQPAMVDIAEGDPSEYGFELFNHPDFILDEPGSRVRHHVVISNTSANDDSFDITVIGEMWEANTPVDMALVPAGGNLQIPVVVTIPMEATAGASDTTYVVVTSRGDDILQKHVELRTIVPDFECREIEKVEFRGLIEGETLFVGTPIYFDARPMAAPSDPPRPPTGPFTFVWLVDGVVQPVEGHAFELFEGFATAGEHEVSVTVSNPCSDKTESLSGNVVEYVSGESNMSRSSKRVEPVVFEGGDSLSYTIFVYNSGDVTATMIMTDPLPANTSYSGGDIVASDGTTVMWNATDNRFEWAGNVGPDATVFIDFALTPDITSLSVWDEIVNLASVNDGNGNILTLDATSYFNPGYTMSINDGAIATNVPTVTLKVTYKTEDNITDVKFSNDGGFGTSEGSNTTEYISVSDGEYVYTDWTLVSLSNTLIPRTVYAKFRDGDSETTMPIQDDIIFDNVAPSTPTDINIEAEPSETHVSKATSEQWLFKVSMKATDDNSGVKEIQFGNDANFADGSYESVETAGSVNASVKTDKVDPNEDIYARTVDNAGNPSVSSSGVKAEVDAGPVTSVTIVSLPSNGGTLSLPASFSATVNLDATLPVTMVWTVDGQETVTDTLTAEYSKVRAFTWDSTGEYNITVSAKNDINTEFVTGSITYTVQGGSTIYLPIVLKN